MAALRVHTDSAMTNMNGVIAGITAASTTAPKEGGGASKKDPLAINKLFADLPKLTGTEDHNAIDDWFAEIIMYADQAIPMAGEVMQWAMKQAEK